MDIDFDEFCKVILPIYMSNQKSNSPIRTHTNGNGRVEPSIRRDIALKGSLKYKN
jgi:hypothetical protein